MDGHLCSVIKTARYRTTIFILTLFMISETYSLALFYNQFQHLGLLQDRPVTLTPRDITCKDQTLKYSFPSEAYEYEYSYNEREAQPIECSTTCPKIYPFKYATQDLIGSTPLNIGYPGCTDMPPLARITPSIGTVLPFPTEPTLPTRSRRQSTVSNTCALGIDLQNAFNVSETYTLWIRPDQEHSHGTILSTASQANGLNGGFELILTNSTLKFHVRYQDRSFYKYVIPKNVWTHIGIQISTVTFQSSVSIFLNGKLLEDQIILNSFRQKRSVDRKYTRELSDSSRLGRKRRAIALGDGSVNNPVFFGLSGAPYFEGHECKATVVERCIAAGHSAYVHVPPNTNIDAMEKIVQRYLNLANDQTCRPSRTPQEDKLKDLFLCAQYLPGCSTNGAPVRPCTSLCKVFQNICPQIEMKCPDTDQDICVDLSYTPDYGMFRGSIKNAVLHQGPLTVREMMQLYSGTLPTVSPANKCLCPYPGIDMISPLVCSSVMGRLGGDLNRLGETYRVPEAINDRLPPFKSYSQTEWFSKDGVEELSITIEFQQEYLVSNLTYQLPRDFPSLFARLTTIQLRDAKTGLWRTIGYLTNNCSEVSPILETTDYLTLTQPSCEQTNLFQNNLQLEFLRGRSGVDLNQNGVFEVHPLVQYYLTGSAIRLVLEGHMDEENDFYGISNLEVNGWDVSRNVCDCFENTRCGDSGRCVCRVDAGDPVVTGYTCYPYVQNRDKSSPAVIPPYGPKSGGTDVYIFGGYLGRQNDTVNVKIGAIECPMINRTETLIHCRTVNVNYTLPLYTPLPINVLITSVRGARVDMILDETFMFKEDPVIKSIEPRSTFLRGGIRQTVIGRYLDSVFAPAMNVTMLYLKDGKHYLFPQEAQICEVVNGSSMLCPAPRINTDNLPPELQQLLNSNSDGTVSDQSDTGARGGANMNSEPTRRKRQSIEFGLVNREYLEFYIGLRFDGVKRYQNVSTELPNQGTIKVFENPEIYRWDRNGNDLIRTLKTYKGENFITIEGANMRFGCTESDYEISIAGSVCTVDTLYSGQLLCVPPSTRPELNNILHKDGAPPVELTVGNINELIGYLRYEETLWDNPTVRVAVISVIVIVVLLVIAVVIAVFLKKRRQRLKEKHDAERNKYVTPVSLWEKLPLETKAEVEPCIKKSESLKLGRKLGEGNFGTVHMGRYDDEKNGAILVAAKTVKNTGLSVKDLVEFLDEATLMKDFNHDNVLHLVGVVLQEGKPYVILPLMERGDLRHYILNPSHKFTVADLLDFGLQVARGMGYLASRKFVHRDLAARNCMVGTDNIVKVADFGLARDIYSNEYYRVENKSRPLPVKWMAPEALDDHKFTSKSDVWSYGVVLWELLTRGKRPYAHIDNFELKNYLRRGNRLEKPEVAPDEVYELMVQCWNMNPTNRPQFSQAVHELETILNDDDGEGDTAPAPPTSPTSPTTAHNTGYDHLNRYVEYGTDRGGYENLHEQQGYLDMLEQVDYVQAAKELGVDVEDTKRTASSVPGYLDMVQVDSRNSSARSSKSNKPVPAPKPRKTNKPLAPSYQNVEDIRNQLSADDMKIEGRDNVSVPKVTYSKPSLTSESNKVVKPDNIELLEVKAPERDNMNDVPVYQNSDNQAFIPDYLQPT